MNFIIAQILGIIVTIYAIASTQFKSVHALLIASLITNVLTALNYVLLDSTSGTWVCVVAAVHAVLMQYLNAKNNSSEKKKNMCGWLFAVIYVAGSIYCFKNWLDILPCICALIYTACVYQKDVIKYKGFSILNSFAWAIYDFTTGAYTMILTRVLLILLSLFSVYRIKREVQNKRD